MLIAQALFHGLAIFMKERILIDHGPTLVMLMLIEDTFSERVYFHSKLGNVTRCHQIQLSFINLLQNQEAVQNFSGMQNFLGLSMNGNISQKVLGEGMNRHAFPGFYLNEHPQHVLTATSNTLPGTSGMRGRPHKRDRTEHGMDMLEPNTQHFLYMEHSC